MCGRFIASTDANWERFFSLKKPPPRFVSWNVTPSRAVPVVRADLEGNRCELLRWGLIPHFAHGVAGKYHTINARSETIASSPAYRGAWRRAQRCLVPANGFYEWQQLPGDRKQPFFIRLAEHELFAFAGIWDASITADGTTIESFSIATIPASPLMASIHNGRERQPVIVLPEAHEVWLRGTESDARALMKALPDESLLAWPVSSRVNTPRNDDERLTAPLEAQAGG